MRYSDDGPHQDNEWVGDWVSARIKDARESGFGVLAVTDRANGGILGYCGLVTHAELDGQPEISIGYRLIKRYWGHGFGSEAASAVMAHAHSALRIKRVVATIDPHNDASLRLAKKIGMVYEKDVMLPGYTYPDHLYTSVD